MSTYTMAAVEARKLAGEMVPMDASQAGEGKLAFTLRRPIGIVGAISPFNFPLNLVAHKLAPALAAGCPVVLKPATATPLSALLLAELEDRGGAAAGLAQRRRRASAEIGDVLVADERVKLITFTGSGPVGWALRERAPRKRVNLELGNATPVIVAADADLDEAAAKLAGERVLVRRPELHLRAADLRRAAACSTPFLERFLPKVEALVVGDPADEDDRRRPADRRRRPRPRPRVDRGGARRRAPRSSRAATSTDGLIRPTVIANAAPELKVSCDEVFGPVCTVNAVRLARRGVSRSRTARATASRRASSPRACESALRAAQALDFGGVTINEAPTFRADQMPYGGVKDSGNTREGPAYAVREMTEERLVVLELLSG